MAIPQFSSDYFNPFGLTTNIRTFVDIDGDGDSDGFTGDSEGNILFFKNTGTISTPDFPASKINPFGLTNIIGNYLVPSFVDIDADGDLDVFIGNDVDVEVLFFKNTGNVNHPAFIQQNSNFGLTDVGSAANPTFVDIDNDKDMDAFVGNSESDTLFFQNIGTSSNPIFANPKTNPFGITKAKYYGLGTYNASPSFVDIEGDGDMDMFISSYSGDYYDPWITEFFENTGTVNKPEFSKKALSPLGLSSNEPLISFVDIDADGDKDAFGEGFSKNTGTAKLPAFTQLHNPFGLPYISTLADIDADGDVDVFSGPNFFENIGTARRPSFATPKSNSFGLTGWIDSFADIDGDGDLDAFHGQYYDETLFFENTGTVNSPAFILTDAPFGLTYDVRNLTFADIDGDGDLDAYAEGVYGVHNFKNAGTVNKAKFIFDGGISGDRYGNDPYLVDLNSDGDFDLLIGYSEGGTGFYNNKGTFAKSEFVRKSGSSIGIVDIGAYAHPSAADIDGDHDEDVFINDFFFENNLAINGTSKADFLTGTSTADLINGFSGDDEINSKAGKDILYGDIGLDTLVGAKGADNLKGGAESDALSGGLGRDMLWGGSGDDILKGGDGNDKLGGCWDNDVLTGGAGKDRFFLGLYANSQITDFSVVDDTLKLKSNIFSALIKGVLAADMLVSGTDINAAVDTNDYLIYNRTDGKLYYDADGSGAELAVQIALIGADLNLTNEDFVVV